MLALQSNWTRPFFVRNPGREYTIEDFDLLTTVLSALEWRRHNGRIVMAADEEAARFYRERSLLALWDEVVMLTVPQTLDPDIFWAAGKLYALGRFSAPLVMMDTDFIVWEKIPFELIGCDAAAVHREELYPDVYPDPGSFSMKEGYRFGDRWDWDSPAFNTAFVYFRDPAFLRRYLAEAYRFMENAREPDNFLTYMVFAEQRMMGLLRGEGFRVEAFSSLDRLFSGGGCFTHTWGFKEQMRRNERARRLFCEKCANRIRADFPEWAEILRKDADLCKFF